MGYIHCCGALRKSKSYKIEPQEGYVLCEADFLEECPICGHCVLQITKIDFREHVSTCRKTNFKALSLFEKIKSRIICEKKVQKIFPQGGKFYLYFSEYGKKKKCYSNLSSLKLGIFENKTLNNNNSFNLSYSKGKTAE